jgi:hypothetical protein
MATNNPIMTDYSTLEQINRENDLTAIEVQRGIGSYFPIFVSLGITLYGFFLFLQTIITTEYVIYGTLAFLGILLIYIEHHRAGLISDFLGSKLEKLINKLATIPSIGLMMGVAITILFIALDTWGAMQSADSIERMLLSGIVKNSEQYKIEEAKAKSGANEAKAYQQQLREWRIAKTEHYKGCNASWKVPTYRTKNQQCKDKFREAKPTAVNNTDGTIPINVYNEMEAKAKGEVTGYRKMFFWVFLGFSILLNYFAMASLFNQYRTKRKELTPEMIDELTDRMELMNAEKINKISMSTKAQKQKLEEKNFIDVEIEKETYNIVIAKRAKALMRKKEIPLKIMNNQNVMENKKAGFIDVSFSSNQQKEKNYQEEPKDFYSPTDEVGIFDKLFLEKEGKESDKMKGAEQKLNPKTKVIDITKRAETTALSRVYKKMVSRGIAELRGNKGYYSLMGYSDAFLAFRVTEDKKETDTYDFNLGDY